MAKIKRRIEQLEVIEHPAILARILDYQVAPHHQTILDYLIRSNNDKKRTLVLAPRGGGKSTVGTIVYSLWRILKNPNIRILIVSNTETMAAAFLAEMKQHVESNRKFNFLFGNLVGSKWTYTEVNFKNKTKLSKESNITTMGIYGSIISKHYDLIIVDDIVDQENARTQTQREKLLQWYKMSLRPTLEPGGEIVMIGTRYHIHDIYGSMIKTTYAKDYKIIKAIENKESFWPEYFSYEHLTETRKEMGTATFNAQYQNDPSQMTGGQFKPEWFQLRWIWINDKWIKIPGSKEVSIKSLKIYQGMDLAISMKTEADFTAHITIGHDLNDGHIYVLDVVRGRFTPMEQERLVEKQFDKWSDKASRPVSVGIESIAYQEALALQLATTAPHIPVIRIKPYKDKLTRAMTVVAIAEDGRLHLPEVDCDELLDELIDFPQGDHDDLVDSLEMAIQGSKRGKRFYEKPEGA